MILNVVIAEWLPDLDKILPFLEKLLQPLFGRYAGLALQVVEWLLFAIVLLGLVWTILFLVEKLKGSVRDVIVPLFYNPVERRRMEGRRRFAEHIAQEIRLLDSKEDWKDYRFAELEAEVEATGRSRFFSSVLPHLFNRQPDRLRHERSLSRALQNSRERLILLEGDPGSGKSTALRHVAHEMARKAAHSRSIGSVIPVYVNLKGFSIPAGAGVTRAHVEDFVKATLNRPNDRDIAEFIEGEFQAGLRAGTWLFLFDSFDEIPAVLSATGTDQTVSDYAESISDFLSGFNLCRGVVGSRLFRGPRQLGWPRFQIAPLSGVRQAELIRKSGLPPEPRRDLKDKLAAAPAVCKCWRVTRCS
jgi:hypothetical protein